MRDDELMRRALRLAMRGRGLVEPNPMVGCVLWRDGRVIGEGFHERVGGPHAEPNALAAAGGDARGATAFVTLEPCCHSGGEKRTPPCAPRLIEAGVARVVVGCLDPNPRVSGGGIRMLRDAGIRVDLTDLGDEARQLIAPFHAITELKRPYVTLKWAVSADGRVAGRQGRPVRITNARSDALVQGLRGRCDAIGVGTNTVVNDDPRLTARGDDPPRRPIRVVFSNSLRFASDRRLLEDDATKLVVYTSQDVAKPGWADADHVDLVPLPATDNGRGGSRFSMLDAYRDLARRNVAHLLIEPGPKLAGDLIANDLADRAWTFDGSVTIGDEGLSAPACDWPSSAVLDLDGDRLTERLNPASSAFFALAASADVQAAR